jgi:hypothetical protein
MSVNRRWSLPGLVLVVGCALAACGSDDAGVVAASDESPSSSPSSGATQSESPESPETPESTPAETDVPAGAPACADVWEAGAKLPRTYSGCVEAGDYVKRDVLECSSGQRIVRFDEAYWAALGGTIKQAATTPLKKDADYVDFVVNCRA